jgi:lysophospholipase L1-like esterase
MSAGPKPRRLRRGAVALAVALLVAACSGSHHSTPAGRAVPIAPPVTGLYVAVGASETRGVGTKNPLREAWTQDLFRTLPSGYDFVNLGVSGATVSQALSQQLPAAQSLHPTLVTVWLNVNDLLFGVPVGLYQSQLNQLIHGLRATGATVLVANTPALDKLPAYLACLDPAGHPSGCSPFVPSPVPAPALVIAAVAAYNAAIAQVASANGAVLVDLHAALAALGGDGTAGVSGAGVPGAGDDVVAGLVSDDGFHPNAAGYQLVADRFAAALAKLPKGVPGATP